MACPKIPLIRAVVESHPCAKSAQGWGTRSVLFFSVAAALFLLSVLSWADDSEGTPRWCAKAKTKVEKLICEGGQLGEFDRELAVYYETLLEIVTPDARSGLVESQKKWIAEREQCDAIAKKSEDLLECVATKIHQRSVVLVKDIQERNTQERLSEFRKFKLRTFKNEELEFQYPGSWKLERKQDGEISLRSEPEEMILGSEKAVSSSKQCTYSEEGRSEGEIRRFFYQGERRIGGEKFDTFYRGWIPSGEEHHYYGFFNGRCFAIHVSDNSQAGSGCGRMDDGEGRAYCVIAKLGETDLLAYSEGVIRTIRFLNLSLRFR